MELGKLDNGMLVFPRTLELLVVERDGILSERWVNTPTMDELLSNGFKEIIRDEKPNVDFSKYFISEKYTENENNIKIWYDLIEIPTIK
jgi:hypothetical protein